MLKNSSHQMYLNGSKSNRKMVTSSTPDLCSKSTTGRYLVFTNDLDKGLKWDDVDRISIKALKRYSCIAMCTYLPESEQCKPWWKFVEVKVELP